MGVLRHHFYFEPYSCTAYVQLYVRVARGVQQSDLHPFVVAARAGEHNPAHPSFPRDLAIAETVILMAPPPVYLPIETPNEGTEGLPSNDSLVRVVAATISQSSSRNLPRPLLRRTPIYRQPTPANDQRQPTPIYRRPTPTKL